MTMLQRVADHDISEPVLSLEDVRSRLADGLYQGYAYSYPHKSAYRRLEPGLPLTDVWQAESGTARGLYVHIPFCDMRCGFCNLFTSVNRSSAAVDRYLAALETQSQVVADALGHFETMSLTIGGGTPTYLSARQLDRLFDSLSAYFAVDFDRLDSIVETSPETATSDRLRILESFGVKRISIGVQSFADEELRALGRPSRARQSVNALDAIRHHDFACLNIDLIYGAHNQTSESWTNTVRTALRWEPEEIFLYPLYVRALTGLDGRAQVADRHRQKLYQAGRDVLLQAGYEQLSMRMFAKRQTPDGRCASGSASGESGDADRSLVGLGCGARSRTSRMHYSTEYAVGRKSVTDIITAYCEADPTEFAHVRYGVELDKTERLHRMFVRNVLTRDGLDLTVAERVHGRIPAHLRILLSHLVSLKMFTQQDDHVVPTAKGLMHADAIGPLFYSRQMTDRMAGFKLR